MAYTTIDKPSDYFNTVIWTGDGTSSRGITGVGFQPDFVWLKRRDSAGNQNVYDVIRGATNYILTDSANAEATIATRLTSFDSDGFTVGNNGNTNTSSGTYVAWNWLTDNTTGSSNTDGSITSTVSANTTAGFSIGTYTGNSTSGATVGHGLSDTPDCIIVKTTNASDNWQVYHQALGNTSRVELNNTDAKGTSTALWNNTSPTSSVFSLGNGSVTNSSSRNYVFYAFAGKKGYSKFGSYTGNGSTNGTFVYTGFKPAWVMIKRTNSTSNWTLWDTTRQENEINKPLWADLSNAEAAQTTVKLDLLSNGFKIRGTGTNVGLSGSTYIYMAFAENPFVTGAVKLPSTAR